MSCIRFFLILFLLGAGGHAVAKDEASFVIEEEGRSTFRSLFDSRKSTSAEQWDYASRTRDAGHLKKAERRLLYLHRRWPNSKEASWAARARADILFERGLWEEAFEAYQYLINNYSSRMQNYDSALEKQFDIAVKIMNRKRMKWMFGGYSVPEYAIEYFEKIIRNGPQWPRAPEVQFMIGQCHQQSEDYEMAITAYAVLGYRYPDHELAEEAAWQQILCLSALREDYPVSPDLLDRTLTASTVFLSKYPQSQYANKLKQLRNEMYEIMAGMRFEEADFYARVPKQYEAAILAYQRMIEEYPKSRRVAEAQQQVAELEALMAKPVHARTADAPYSRPITGVKDVRNADG